MMKAIRFLCFAFVLVSFASCSRHSKQFNFVLPVSSLPGSRDPVQMLDEASAIYSGFAMRGLYKTDVTGRIVPQIASEKMTARGLVFGTALRSALFTDGTTVSPADVLYSLRRLQQSGRQTWILDGVQTIRSAGDRIEFVTDGTISPESLMARLTLPAAAIYNQQSHSAGEFVFSAPFREIWRNSDSIVFQHSSGKSLQLSMHASPASAYFAMRRGLVSAYMPQGAFRRMPVDSRYTFQGYTGETVLYAAIVSGNHACLSQREFRLQLRQIYPAEKIFSNTFQNSYVMAAFPVPNSYKGSIKVSKESQPVTSRALPACRETIDLYTTTDRDRQAMARVLQDILLRENIPARIRILDFQALKKSNAAGLPGIYFLKWVSDYPHPENFLIPLFHSRQSGGGGNRSHFRSPRMDALLEEYARTGKATLFIPMQRILEEETPWLFTAHEMQAVYLLRELPVEIPILPNGWGEAVDSLWKNPVIGN